MIASARSRARTVRIAGAAALALLTIEILIAAFAHDRFVRPYLGDVLAVMLVHFALRAMTPWQASTCAASALAIGVVIECAQGLHLLDRLGLAQVMLLRIVLGSSFEWLDLLAYLAGAVLALVLDRQLRLV